MMVKNFAQFTLRTDTEHSTDYINQGYRHNLLSLLQATSIVSRYCNRLDIANIDNF